MHVAYIHQHFQTLADSSGTRSYELARRLIRAGHRVSMISGASESVAQRLKGAGDVVRENADGIDVNYINEPYANKMSFWRRVLAFQRFAARSRKVAIDLKPDLIFATSTPLTVGLPAMKAAAKLGVPFVFEIRDPWPELPIEMGVINNPVLKWYLRRMERRIYHAATHCIGLSPGMKDAFVQQGVPERRVSVIPNGCDLTLFSPERSVPESEWIGDRSRCRFVFSGAHGHCNGLDALIDAAVELKKRGERGIQMICIGTGVCKPGHIERTKREGVEDYLLWHDPIPKAKFAKLLPTFDVGLMILANYPIFYYGTSPNKFFDYISCGMPVLNNYPGWLADMIGAEDLGHAIAPNDAKAMADSLVWFRDHPEERSAMGARSRAFAEREFAREKLADQFVNVIEAVHERWDGGYVELPQSVGAA